MSVNGAEMAEEYAVGAGEAVAVVSAAPEVGIEIGQTDDLAFSSTVPPAAPSTDVTPMEGVQQTQAPTATVESPPPSFSSPFVSVKSAAEPTSGTAATIPYPLPHALTLSDAPLLSADLVSPINPTFSKQQPVFSTTTAQNDSNATSYAGSSRASSAGPLEDLKLSISLGTSNSPQPTMERASASTEGGSSDERKDNESLLAASRDQSESSGSGKSTPRSNNDVKPLKRLKKVKIVERPAVLIGHLPLAETAAAKTYTVLESCTYASKALGNLIEYGYGEENCDCVYREGKPAAEQACGADSKCVNRLMQIECVNGSCRCFGRCQNQRFENKQYAQLDIVKTEKKGFGVRTVNDLITDEFVYEYVGDVIGPTSFAKRMKDYHKEGIVHFYFMALDKEVYIDATKRGGKGRFLNHSCNPNCYVAKWTVGKKMRMGIFAKRDVKANEELTFNYNVDRYGHAPQECYCGEPNCVGFIGGKTQTDIGGMDDLYIEALGIANQVEALGLRGTKKKSGKKLDIDFDPIMEPIKDEEVAKVAAAIKQAVSIKRILVRLLQRVILTQDQQVQFQLLRLHGFAQMNHILREHDTDVEVVLLVLEILGRWPLLARNKIENCKIDTLLTEIVERGGNPEIQALATTLLSDWSQLELAYRIPRGSIDVGEENERKRAADQTIELMNKRARLSSSGTVPTLDTPIRPVYVRPTASARPIAKIPLVAPFGWKAHRDGATGNIYYHCAEKNITQWPIPTADQIPKDPALAEKEARALIGPLDVQTIIAQAQAIAEEKRKEEQAKKEREDQEELQKIKDDQGARAAQKANAKAASKDKKVMTLFSTIVIGVMSKYKSHLDPAQFKKRAREVTQVLCDKEKRHPLYVSETYDQLSAEKQSKVRNFTKDWVKKLIEKSKKNSLNRGSSSSHKPRSNSDATPSSSKSRLSSVSLDTPSFSTPSSRNNSVSVSTPEANGVGEAEQEEQDDFIASMVAEVEDREEMEAEAEGEGAALRIANTERGSLSASMDGTLPDTPPSSTMRSPPLPASATAELVQVAPDELPAPFLTGAPN